MHTATTEHGCSRRTPSTKEAAAATPTFVFIVASWAAARGPGRRPLSVLTQTGSLPRMEPEMERAAATPFVMPHLSKPVAA